MAMPPAARRAPHGITRVNHAPSRTRAWRAAIRRQGKAHVGRFSDGVHGSRQKARAAAEALRDAVAARRPPLSRKDYCAILRRDNRSGRAGMSFPAEVTASEKGPVERRLWIARCPMEPWRAKLVKFSVAKYGADGAFRRGVKARLSATFSPHARRRALTARPCASSAARPPARPTRPAPARRASAQARRCGRCAACARRAPRSAPPRRRAGGRSGCGSPR